jgi:predicted TIM-barrel fold metal-dependent hydrolase
MIIDCHTHLGRNEHINANVKELLESMDEAGIDKALVFAGELNDCPNEWMLEQIAPHKDRLLGVAAASPKAYAFVKPSTTPYANDFTYAGERVKAFKHESEEVKQLTDWYGEGKIVAVKFYVGYEHYTPEEAPLYLTALNRLQCPAIFHMGDCLNSVKKSKLKYSQPLLIDDVAVDYPDMNFIIAHMAYPFQRDAAEVCYKNDNVFTDVSGFVYDNFKDSDRIKFKKVINEVLDISSSDKLLFGTDWPIANQASYIDALDNCYGELMTPQSLTQNIEKAFKL